MISKVKGLFQLFLGNLSNHRRYQTELGSQICSQPQYRSLFLPFPQAINVLREERPLLAQSQ